MLNEYLELEAYVKNPKSDKPRIQPNYFTGSFEDVCELNGLEQILTTIARGYLFTYCPKEYDINDKVKNTLHVLRKWCGFTYEDSNEFLRDNSILAWFKDFPETDGWLKSYWMYHFDQKKKEKDSKKDKKMPSAKQASKKVLWEKVEKQWNNSLNGTYDYQARKITYKNIIASALELGPLQKRYLVFKKDNNAVKVSVKKQFDYLYELGLGKKTVQEETRYKFLKSVANYLILKEQHPEDQTSVWLKAGPLLGWYGQDDIKNDSKIRYFPFLLWNRETIFIREGGGSNYVKLGMNQDYLEKFDFHLIEENQIEEFKESYWVLEDCGHGEKLMVINNQI